MAAFVPSVKTSRRMMKYIFFIINVQYFVKVATTFDIKVILSKINSNIICLRGVFRALFRILLSYLHLLMPMASYYSSNFYIMETVLITGGTGMIGKHLTELLVLKGYNVIIVSRSEVMARRHASISYAIWDVENQTIDKDAIERADYIINLAGAGVADKRWTTARKKEIVESRINSGKLIVNALQSVPNKIKCVVNASAIGWYGADPATSLQKGFTEEAPADNQYLGKTCQLWEESIEPVISLGIRLVKLRTGIVLSNNGGALVEFKKPLKFGIAAILGNGKQVVSWIHVEDLCRMFVYAIEQNKISGVYNAVSTNPITNEELTLTLAKTLRGKSYMSLHVPAFLLKIILGEMSTEVLKSATVNNSKILSTGFSFYYPTIEKALQDLKENEPLG